MSMETMETSRGREVGLGLYALLAALGFGVVAYLDRRRRLDRVNISTTRALQKYCSRELDAAMSVPSLVGYPPQLYLISGSLVALLFAIGRNWDGEVAAGTMAAPLVLGGIAKRFVSEPRPKRMQVGVERRDGGKSFPSGHALFFTSFYGFLWYVCYAQLPPTRLRTWALVSLGALVFPYRRDEIDHAVLAPAVHAAAE